MIVWINFMMEVKRVEVGKSGCSLRMHLVLLFAIECHSEAVNRETSGGIDLATGVLSLS